MKRIAAAAALALVACTAKAGGEQIEKKITELLTTQGAPPTKVTCPKAIEVKVGAVFTCQATFDNGETFIVTGTVTSKKGTAFEYNTALPEPKYVTAELEKEITDGITAQRSAPKSVTCGKPGLHHAPADHKVECVAVDSSDVKYKVVFTFTDAGVPKGWEVVD